MGNDVGTLGEDVPTELEELGGGVGLEEPVATTDTIPADHDQIPAYVIPGMLADVVEGQRPRG